MLVQVTHPFLTLFLACLCFISVSILVVNLCVFSCLSHRGVRQSRAYGQVLCAVSVPARPIFDGRLCFIIIIVIHCFPSQFHHVLFLGVLHGRTSILSVQHKRYEVDLWDKPIEVPPPHDWRVRVLRILRILRNWITNPAPSHLAWEAVLVLYFPTFIIPYCLPLPTPSHLWFEATLVTLIFA